MSTPFYYFVGIVSWPVLRLLYRLRWHGGRTSRRAGSSLPRTTFPTSIRGRSGYPLWPKRRMRWMGKSELFNRVLAPILLRGGAFPVRRGTNDREAIERAIDLARSGRHRRHVPGGDAPPERVAQEFRPQAHTGAARIAIVAEVPLVPAAVIGTDRLARLGPLRVLYGKPIPLEDLR